MSDSPPPQTLSWMDWANLRYSLEWIYKGRIDPEYRIMHRYIPGQAAFLVQEGQVEIRCEEGQVVAGPGEWLLLNAGIRRQEFSANAEILSIRFHWTWPGGQPLFDWGLARHMVSTEVPALKTAALKLEKCVRRSSANAGAYLPWARFDLEHHLEIQSVFMEWLRVYAQILLERGQQPSRFEVSDPRLMRAIQILDHHPLDQPLTEANLARQVDLSLGQFSHLFTQQFGISPFRYLERRRLTEAVARVRGSDTPLKAIAIDLGFSSLSHFSSWFRRKTNQTPTSYREQQH